MQSHLLWAKNTRTKFSKKKRWKMVCVYPINSHFLVISQLLFGQFSPNFHTAWWGSLALGPLNKVKECRVVWTCNVCKRILLATIMQKYVFDHNFELRHLGWRFLASRFYVFWGQGVRWCHLVWPMTLTFQSHDLCEITFWAISRLLIGKMLPNFNTR